MSDRPINLIKLTDKDKKKYFQLKEKENEKYIAGDLILISDDEYAIVSKESILLKQKINKYNIVLRKK